MAVILAAILLIFGSSSSRAEEQHDDIDEVVIALVDACILSTDRLGFDVKAFESQLEQLGFDPLVIDDLSSFEESAKVAALPGNWTIMERVAPGTFNRAVEAYLVGKIDLNLDLAKAIEAAASQKADPESPSLSKVEYPAWQHTKSVDLGIITGVRTFSINGMCQIFGIPDGVGRLMVANNNWTENYERLESFEVWSGTVIQSFPLLRYIFRVAGFTTKPIVDAEVEIIRINETAAEKLGTSPWLIGVTRLIPS